MAFQKKIENNRSYGFNAATNHSHHTEAEYVAIAS